MPEKITRKRKSPEVKTQDVLNAFDKLPFDEMLKVLSHVSGKVAEEKHKIVNAAEEVLKKYK